MGQLKVLSVVRRFWKLMVVITVLVALVAVALSYLQPTRYVATIDVYLSDPTSAGVYRPERQTPADFGIYLASEAESMTSASALGEVASVVGRGWTEASLVKYVHAEVQSSGAPAQDYRITIRAMDGTYEGAVEVANAVVQVYEAGVQRRVQADLAASLSVFEDQRSVIEGHLSEVQAALEADPGNAALQADMHAGAAALVDVEGQPALATTRAELFDSGVLRLRPGPVPRGPVQPRPLRNGLLGGLLGLLAAALVAWALSQQRKVIGSPREACSILGVPLLGAVPLGWGRGASDGEGALVAAGPAAESYLFAALALGAVLKQQPAGVVCVTSASPGDRSCRVSLNLAAALAVPGRRVALVDGAGGGRGLSGCLALGEGPGLTDLGRGMTVEECWQSLEGAPERLKVVGAGFVEDAGCGFPHTVGFRQAMGALRGQVEMVVIDTLPILASAGAASAASIADGAVMLVGSGTPFSSVVDAGQRVAAMGTPILGVVFGCATARESRLLCGYGG